MSVVSRYSTAPGRIVPAVDLYVNQAGLCNLFDSIWYWECRWDGGRGTNASVVSMYSVLVSVAVLGALEKVHRHIHSHMLFCSAIRIGGIRASQ